MTEDVWIPENAQELVAKYVGFCKLLFTNYSDKIVAAHDSVDKSKATDQDAYALEFACALKNILLAEYAGDTIALEAAVIAARMVGSPPPRQPLVQADTQSKTRPLVSPTKTVEEWEREGLRFRPAVARVALPKDEPQDNTPRARHLEHAQALHEAVVATGEGEHAPWGQSAAAMAEWAWQVATGRKISVSQRTALADVLTVLYHAGIMPEGSIIPVGFWHKGHVRGAKRGK